MSWSLNEKHKLLLALEEFGPNNIPAIVKSVESKSFFEVKKAIETYKTVANQLNKVGSSKKRSVPIEEWIDILNKQESLCVPRALKYISMFEEHPESVVSLK